MGEARILACFRKCENTATTENTAWHYSKSNKQTNKQTRMSMNGNEQEEARSKKGGRLYDFFAVVVKWIRRI